MTFTDKHMRALIVKRRKREDGGRCKQWKREMTRGREMCNLPLCQPPQHNKVIKSDSFACYAGDDIYPSFSEHLRSLPTRQSLHPSHFPPAPRLSRK